MLQKKHPKYLQCILFLAIRSRRTLLTFLPKVNVLMVGVMCDTPRLDLQCVKLWAPAAQEACGFLEQSTHQQPRQLGAQHIYGAPIFSFIL